MSQRRSSPDDQPGSCAADQPRAAARLLDPRVRRGGRGGLTAHPPPRARVASGQAAQRAAVPAAVAGPLRTLVRCVGLGTAHFPENLHKCYVINAPKIISFAWKAVQPALNQRTRDKVSISSGVPASLVETLGGEDKLQELFATVARK